MQIVPLSVWYPAMYEKWQDRLVYLESQGVKTVYELDEREAWVHHHTAGGAGWDPVAYARFVADMHWDRWQRPGGYNFFGGLDGRIFEMCGWLHRGVHSGTHYWNKHGLGYAYQGNYHTTAPAGVMLDSARSLIAELPIAQTYHRKVRPTYTDCPGDALIALLPLEDDMPTPEEIADAVWARRLKQYGDFLGRPDEAAGALLGQAHANAWQSAKQTTRTAIIAAVSAAGGFTASEVVDLIAQRLGG